MKILFCVRVDIFENVGGDKVQVEKTKQVLEELGHEITITNTPNVDYTLYDIVHVFQLDWAPESNIYVRRAKSANVPVVLSPIHHSVKDLKKYDDYFTFGLRKISGILFKDQFSRDTLKNVYRCFKNPKKIESTLLSIKYGLFNLHKNTLELSDLIIVQTWKEKSDLEETYSLDLSLKTKLVPNGVSDDFINPAGESNLPKFENYIINVGRIEPRKNQLSIIDAMKVVRASGKDVSLILVGKRSSNHKEYISLINREIKENDWISYFEYVPQSELASLYKNSSACISASWFETTGLTLLEALYSGTKIIASGEREREIFGDLAVYCTPDSIESIAYAIRASLEMQKPIVPQEFKNTYTWTNTGKILNGEYKNIAKK